MWTPNGLRARSAAARLAALTVLALATPAGALADDCASESGCTEDARSASAFVDSVGVNTHLGYSDQVYGTAWPMVRDRLLELGVRHVRDATYRDGIRLTDVVPRMRELAARGIRGNLLSGNPQMRWGAGTIDQHLAWVRKNVPGFVEALEGPNEYDRPSDDPDWEQTLRAYQCEWAQKIRADPALAGVRVIGPAPGGVGFGTLGDLTGCLDAGNLHPYPGSWSPDTSNVGDLSRQMAGAQKVSGAKPIWITEAGYHNAVACSCGHSPVSEAAAGVYVPRMFMEYFRRGIPRTYAYELIDGRPDPLRTDPERNFGLLRNDGTPKPAFTATRNLLEILSDTGSATGRLSFSLRCAANCAAPLRHVLLRKATGAYYLAVWPESSVWDEASRTDRSSPEQQVDLRVPAGYALKVFDPERSSTAIGQSSSASYRLALADRMTVVEISPSTAAATGEESPPPSASTATDGGGPRPGPSTVTAPGAGGGLPGPSTATATGAHGLPPGQPPAPATRRDLAAARAALTWTASQASSQLRRAGVARLRRRGTLNLPARAQRSGRYTIRLDGEVNVARGRRSFPRAGTNRIVLRRSARGRRVLRPGSRRRLTLNVAFVDATGTRLSVRRRVITGG